MKDPDCDCVTSKQKPMKKKIVIKKKHQNECGQMIESTEEITSDCSRFNEIFDDLVMLHKQMSSLGFTDLLDSTKPSEN